MSRTIAPVHAHLSRDGVASSRRAIILGAAASGLASIPGEVEAGESDVLLLYRRYCEIEARALGERDCVEMDFIADAMMQLPSVSAADFAAKMVVASCCGDTLPDWQRAEVWREARHLLGEA